MREGFIFGAWIAMAAVLFVLLSPATPGVVAPNGGKLLKPLITLALNLFASLMVCRMSMLMRMRSADHACSKDIEVYSRPTTLLC